MNSSIFRIGAIGHTATVEVTNRQKNVEYKLIDGYADEREVRKTVGNTGREQYSHYYTGWHGERKPAIARIEADIKKLESELANLKFALKVTKKKSWSAVK